ncbi:unnamed protein product [Dibothriocephalus latus]|uniref:Uncharacterized protein n=1 Tax=Dibothriocephalus latus TaxID=60516 RepID=A0A3P7LJ19_DIBLA|nr:unnamed protein product [Dibothriocephalus latus]
MSIGGILRNTVADVPGRRPSTENCPVPGTTTLVPQMTTLAPNMSATPAPAPMPDRGFSFYDLSFLWLTAFALVIGFVVASIVSLISGMNTKKPIRQSLMASQAVAFYNCFRHCRPAQSYDDSALLVSIKFTIQPTEGLRSALAKTYSESSQNFLDACISIQ